MPERVSQQQIKYMVHYKYCVRQDARRHQSSLCCKKVRSSARTYQLVDFVCCVYSIHLNVMLPVQTDELLVEGNEFMTKRDAIKTAQYLAPAYIFSLRFACKYCSIRLLLLYILIIFLLRK
jgi:hypothetical protein